MASLSLLCLSHTREKNKKIFFFYSTATSKNGRQRWGGVLRDCSRSILGLATGSVLRIDMENTRFIDPHFFIGCEFVSGETPDDEPLRVNPFWSRALMLLLRVFSFSACNPPKVSPQKILSSQYTLPKTSDTQAESSHLSKLALFAYLIRNVTVPYTWCRLGWRFRRGVVVV
jgi:hypothetical protein